IDTGSNCPSCTFAGLGHYAGSEACEFIVARLPEELKKSGKIQDLSSYESFVSRDSLYTNESTGIAKTRGRRKYALYKIEQRISGCSIDDDDDDELRCSSSSSSDSYSFLDGRISLARARRVLTCGRKRDGSYASSSHPAPSLRLFTHSHLSSSDRLRRRHRRCAALHRTRYILARTDRRALVHTLGVAKPQREVRIFCAAAKLRHIILYKVHFEREHEAREEVSLLVYTRAYARVRGDQCERVYSVCGAVQRSGGGGGGGGRMTRDGSGIDTGSNCPSCTFAGLGHYAGSEACEFIVARLPEELKKSGKIQDLSSYESFVSRDSLYTNESTGIAKTRGRRKYALYKIEQRISGCSIDDDDDDELRCSSSSSSDSYSFLDGRISLARARRVLTCGRKRDGSYASSSHPAPSLRLFTHSHLSSSDRLRRRHRRCAALHRTRYILARTDRRALVHTLGVAKPQREVRIFCAAAKLRHIILYKVHFEREHEAREEVSLLVYTRAYARVRGDQCERVYSVCGAVQRSGGGGGGGGRMTRDGSGIDTGSNCPSCTFAGLGHYAGSEACEFIVARLPEELKKSGKIQDLSSYESFVSRDSLYTNESTGIAKTRGRRKYALYKIEQRISGCSIDDDDDDELRCSSSSSSDSYSFLDGRISLARARRVLTCGRKRDGSYASSSHPAPSLRLFTHSHLSSSDRLRRRHRRCAALHRTRYILARTDRRALVHTLGTFNIFSNGYVKENRIRPQVQAFFEDDENSTPAPGVKDYKSTIGSLCCPNAMSASSFASNFSPFFIIFRLFCHGGRSKNLPRLRRQRRSGGLSHSTYLAVRVYTTCFERMINDRTHLTSDRRQQQQQQQQRECTYRNRCTGPDEAEAKSLFAKKLEEQASVARATMHLILILIRNQRSGRVHGALLFFAFVQQVSGLHTLTALTRILVVCTRACDDPRSEFVTCNRARAARAVTWYCTRERPQWYLLQSSQLIHTFTRTQYKKYSQYKKHALSFGYGRDVIIHNDEIIAAFRTYRWTNLRIEFRNLQHCHCSKT
ncbi:unnamed protein product, partial [Trichogramma brassicae]